VLEYLMQTVISAF